MKTAKYLLVIAVVATLGWMLIQSGSNEDADRVEELARRQELTDQKRRSETQPVSPDESLDQLAQQGRGMPVPSSLTVSPDPSGFWFVGKQGADVGAELPFPPGQLPKVSPKLKPVNENPGFLGAQACRECHEETYASYAKTSHHLTSHIATPESIRGPLEAGTNKMATFHPRVSYEMRVRDEIPIQRVSFFDWKFDVPMQVVTGSSKLAQTYLFWHGDELFQSNVTYLKTKDAWINSPGYIDGDAAYARPIKARCLECHSTYADFRGPPNHFTPDSLILGISCERCHGPGRDHVEFHQANPDQKAAKFVTVPSDLPRDKELQVCSQCHSGLNPLRGLPYAFRPGDDLTDHYQPLTGDGGNSVHTSNQHARLEKSQCFLESEMTCVDCHNPHQLERGNMRLFSQRCIKCHQPETCGASERVADSLAGKGSITDNCIDCHMPNRAGDHLRLDSASGTVFPVLRDHYIRIDKQAAGEFLQMQSNQ